MTKQQRISIFDVAKMAGVGVATVSRVLNNSPKVSEVTRSKVLKAIEDLDFHPSRLASGLSRGHPDVVAVLVPFITRPSVVARLHGILEVLDSAGLNTVIYSVTSTRQRDRYLNVLIDRHEALGVIAISIPLADKQVSRFSSSEVPISLVDTYSCTTPSVSIDNVLGGSLAGEHLIGLGHQRIAFLGDSESTDLGFSSTQERLRGLRNALRSRGLELPEEYVKFGPHSATDARHMARELLSMSEPPTAIFAGSDTQAMGVLACLEELGLDSPNDVAVVGFDGLEISAILDLSTVVQPLHESGVLGAERLCTLLEGSSVEPLSLVLDIQLLARATTIGAGPVTINAMPP